MHGGQRVRREVLWQEALGRVLGRVRQRQQHQREHEDQPDEHRDGNCRPAYDRSRTEADQGDQAQVGAGQDNRAQHAGLAERRMRRRAGQHRLAGQEGGERAGLPGGERHRADDRGLGGQHDTAIGDAARVALIIPEEYSPLMARTPRTAMASWATATPVKPWLVGSNDALSARDMCVQCAG
jgi:hypothetical protein